MNTYFLLVGNRIAKKIQIYQFHLSGDNLSLTRDNVIWESPEVKYMTEVKPIIYKNKKAILSITENGVIIFELSKEKKIFFHKEITNYSTNMHSAHPLPDGNIVIADSRGWLGILPAEGNDVELPQDRMPWYRLTYAHAVSYDETTHKLYAGGYTQIKKYSYQVKDNKPELNEEATYDISDYYFRCKVYNKCNEDATWEDGIHDMYQVYGKKQGVYFLSTGERVFLFDATKTAGIKSGKITLDKFNPLYEIDSNKSRKISSVASKEEVMLKKGGVKSVSGFINNGDFLTVAHSAPWFTPKEAYPYDGTHLIYATSADDVLDFDITAKHKITFSPPSRVSFYKARLLDKNWMPDV